jgi:hypothetical protein
MVVENGAFISISSGLNVDIWIPLMPHFRPIPNVNLVHFPIFSVAELLIPGEQIWNSHLLQDLLEPSIVQNILSIHLHHCSSFDKWFWAPFPSTP